MKVQISYTELTNWIREKASNANVSYYGSNSIRISYTLNLLFIHKEFYAVIDLRRHSSFDIYLTCSLYNLGRFENKVKNMIKNRLPEFVSWDGNDNIDVDLYKIKALKKAGISLSINSISFDSAGIDLDINLNIK